MFDPNVYTSTFKEEICFVAVGWVRKYHVNLVEACLAERRPFICNDFWTINDVAIFYT
jgi:hypothetical protein